MKSIGFLLLAGFMAFVSLSASTLVASDDWTQPQVDSVVTERRYCIEVDYMYPMRGGARTVTSNYSVTVEGDSLVSYLPYFGVAHRAPLNPSKGLVFEAPIESYSAEKDKKERWQINFETRTDEDLYTYSITIYDDGTSHIDVRPLYKDPISFSGQLADEWPNEEED